MTTFRLSSWFVCHDLRLSDRAEVVVELDHEPTAAEAEALLLPAVDAVVQRRVPDESPGSWRVELEPARVEVETL